jgi:hypothetical protein
MQQHRPRHDEAGQRRQLWSRRYLLDHRHEPHECAAVHASWSGFTSRLRQGATAATCARSGHGIWWALDAASDLEALSELPALVAARTRAIPVG